MFFALDFVCLRVSITRVQHQFLHLVVRWFCSMFAYSTSLVTPATVEKTRDQVGLLHFNPATMDTQHGMDGDCTKPTGVWGADLATRTSRFNEAATMPDFDEFEIVISLMALFTIAP